jgi:hypothetical protein
MRGLWALAMAIALAGCGDVSENAVGADDAPPQGYYVGKADLYRERANDLCRAKDAAFLEKLVSRATGSLPDGVTWTDLEDFNGRTAASGKGMEAVLRFHARVKGADPVMMYASGPFDPATCTVGQMTGGIGSDPGDPRNTTTFEEQG